MSQIFTPDLIEIKPSYIDGFENIVTKGIGTATSSTVFATIGRSILPPNIFNNSRNDVRTKFEYLGRMLGAAGNRQFRMQIDGVTIFTTASFPPSNTEFKGELMIAYRNDQILAHQYILVSPSGVGAATPSAGLLPFANFDNSISHIVDLQALVIVATDSIVLDWFGASIR
jgi:hypothetical protein